MVMAGVVEPLSLPTMHQLLDVMEMIIIEGLGTSNDIQRYYYRTYQPDPKELDTATFTVEETDASFEAFSAAFGGMH